QDIKVFYILGIAALLPLMGCLTVLQTNPYQALVVRGILGAIAALTYTLFGAADVALTEALVGTFLSITLYAVAVRSSLNMRLGVIDPNVALPDGLNQALEPHHLRLEKVLYPDESALQSALINKEIHSSYISSGHLQTRVKRLYNIMASALSSEIVDVSYVVPSEHPPTAHPTAKQRTSS
ncbi:MAG: DUF4040 domain-containing protein, partial [Cyanobacteria bacterium J06598_3]